MQQKLFSQYGNAETQTQYISGDQHHDDYILKANQAYN
jgi:hypothetical protein